MSPPAFATRGHSHREQLAALLATTRALTGPPASDRPLETLVAAARMHTGARVAALWRCDTGNGELVLLVPAREPAVRLHSGAGLAGRCARSGHPLHVADLAEADDVSDIAMVDAGHDPRAGAALNLPLAAADGHVLGVLQLLHPQRTRFDADALLMAQNFAAQCALALLYAVPGATAGATSALHTEVEVAREIQRSTLPTEMPPVPGYDLSGHFQPATYAGGDMFDAVHLPEGVFLLLGDATGHGFGPALSAMEMQGMLRVALRLGADLDRAFQHVNNQLTEDLPDDRFITAFMGFLDATAHAVRYHCAGQGPILHFHAADDRCEWLQPSTFPVGVLHLEQPPEALAFELAPGDILALISDGLYERTDAHDVEFGAERVADVIRAGQHLSMATLSDRLIAAADEFANGTAAADDVTLILVRRLPEHPAHLPST